MAVLERALPILFLAGLLPAQPASRPAEGGDSSSSRPASQGLHWPGDRERPVATLEGKELTLGDLVESLEKGYAPGSAEVFAGPLGRQTLDQSLPFLTHLELDLRLIRGEARSRGVGVDPKEVEAEVEKRFAAHIEALVWKDPTREASLQANRDHLLQVFRRSAGPKAEIDLLLQKLVPRQFSADQIRRFYQKNGRRAEMKIKVAHIFIARVDPATGHLPDPAGVARRDELVRDIQVRLEPDGTNFAEVAIRFSQLPQTAARGGYLGEVGRWSDRYPALSRAAFELKEGAWCGPIEEPDGFHFLKNLKTLGRGSVFVETQIRDELLDDMVKQAREDLVLELRRRARSRLLL